MSERRLLWIVFLFGSVTIPIAIGQGVDQPLSLRILNTGIAFVVVAGGLLFFRRRKHKPVEKPDQ